MKNLKFTGLTLALAIAGLAGCKDKTPVVKVKEVKIDTSECKVNFSLDDKFTSEGLKVSLVFTDGSETEITDFTVGTPSFKKTAENKPVTVSFTYDGVKYESTYSINIYYWSDDDLAVFEAGTILYDVQALPYLPGMEVKTTLDKDGYIEDWWVELANATEADLEAYGKKIAAINKSVTQGSSKYTYKVNSLAELPDGAATYASVDEYASLCFSLAPTSSSGLRGYYFDEYYVVGLNEAGSLIVKTKLVPVYVQTSCGIPVGYFSGDYTLTKDLLDYIWDFFNGHNGEMGDLLSYHAEDKLPQPELAVEKSVNQYPVWVVDYLEANPFAESLEDTQVALGLGLYSATEAERNKFISDLLANGFTAGEEKEVLTGRTTEGDDVKTKFVPYTLEGEYIGSYEVQVSEFKSNFDSIWGVEAASPEEEESGYMIKIFFDRPEVNYTYCEEFLLDEVVSKFAVNKDDLLTSSEYENVFGFYSTEKTVNAAVTSVSSALNGFEVVSGAITEEDGSISLEYRNDTYGFIVNVSSSEDGKILVIIEGYVAIPKNLTAEKLGQIIEAELGSAFTDNGDGSYSAVYDVFADREDLNNAGYIPQIIEYYVATALPEYTELVKEGAKVTLESGGASYTWTYQTIDGAFIIEIQGYQIYSGKTYVGMNFIVTVKPASAN